MPETDSTSDLKPDPFGRIKEDEMTMSKNNKGNKNQKSRRANLQVKGSPNESAAVFPERKVTIHLVRHAQGPHNLTHLPIKMRVNFVDPGLTDLGLAQSTLLRSRFEPMNRITHILSSPMHRTLLTALVAFEPIIAKGLQIVALPELREYGIAPCSTGSDMSLLLASLYSKAKVSRDDCIDASMVPAGWEQQHEGADRAEWLQTRKRRAQLVLEKLHALAVAATKAERGVWEGREVHQGRDVEILVVTHSGLIIDLEQNDDAPSYQNAEYRSYRYPTRDEVENCGMPYYKLIETRESKKRVHKFAADKLE
ncbi:phosphoglycerate mutase [Drepanopeziza brunnea f. sp. 'multigermtubi' MB_m1]|uniref:Phosphoglycerate mutase n=1 Tax=Marssonina brunnea f. sp. multigermtubi (strain MB_m1) TaxID=1072389 RepID=K1WW64_MARBU|nr:phosphoglycerate mutase [Drepanopeziza brunnea f. sp. 'multigermtubi' MB_m1]EKD17271.1 phosphoglycerate mutase [Drepanopeziza brunnea f. sp. 'multigermtubi' MB_m1]